MTYKTTIFEASEKIKENKKIHLKQNGRAALQFLGSLRSTASRGLRKSAKLSFESNKQAKELINYKNKENIKNQSEWRKIIENGDKLARNIYEYQFERYYQYHGGKEIWDRAIPAVEELRSDIEESFLSIDKTGNKDNLELDRNIKFPEYFNIEFHTQPGGWDAYDLYAQVFQYGFGPFVFPCGGFAAIHPGQKSDREEIWNEMPNDNYQSIFEPGCGAGGMLFNARKIFPKAKLVGCDLSEIFLRHGWRMSESLNLNINFKQCLAEQTNEKDNSYDAVISYAFFHELPVNAGKKIINEMYRILKPGGDILIADMPNFNEISLFQSLLLHHETIYHDEPYVTGYCSTDWKGYFKELGFINVLSKSLYNGPGKFPYIYTGTKPKK